MGSTRVQSVCIIFSVANSEKSGALVKALQVLKNNDVNLIHIESRASSQGDGYEFFVECECGSGNIKQAVKELKNDCTYFNLISRDYNDKSSAFLWFPRRICDLDLFADRIVLYGTELNADHPGFTDLEYRKRRQYFTNIALNYKHGQKLPRADYTKEEIRTWGTVFTTLTKLHKTHACREYNEIFQRLVTDCGYREDNIPQLDDVSAFLQKSTGFIIRPVAGFLASRDFLAGLAFRVFHSTQYTRHPSSPLFSPEPDVCHELLGHVPLLADPAFANFSQEIGLASLGAPDEYIQRLATCYWFTIEYGLCRQDGELKAYGAALLSSYGELEYCLSDKPELREFDPSQTGHQKYPITEYQPVYYVADCFESAKVKMIKYANTIPRPFKVRYHPSTQSIEVMVSNTKYE